MSNWEFAARILEEDCGAEVNMDEEYFICPDCEEPIFADDWTSDDFMGTECIVCPICGTIIADHFRIDKFLQTYSN